MTRPRKELVSLDSTPYYHVISRCVRRAFLCGEDKQTGQCFNHRKQWVVDKIKQLSKIFSVDICAYAVMSNHYHLVVCIDKNRALAWSDEEVVVRWYQLYTGHSFVDQWLKGEVLSKSQQHVVKQLINEWRIRLYDIGWYMRNINEHIARQANQEDQCKGRFWEGRYKSQALLDDAALLGCMAYVDLNPIRAALCKTPEDSDFTSIQERIKAYQAGKRACKTLKRFKTNANPKAHQLPIAFSDYLELVDFTGRCIRDDKKGHIPNHLANVLIRLGIKPEHWRQYVTSIELKFHLAVGSEQSLKQYSKLSNHQWISGVSTAKLWFANA